MFHKADGANISNGEPQAGAFLCLFLFVICWFQRINLTKGRVLLSAFDVGVVTDALQDRYCVQEVWRIQVGKK